MNHALRLTLAAGLLFAAGTAIAASDSPVGSWKQVDDVTGKPKSIIQISEVDGHLQGKVMQVMNLSAEEIARDGQHPLCHQCDGDRKDKPIEGMTIMWGVSKDDEVWDGGKILDPKSGKVYKVKLALADGGNKLDVRGYIGFSLFGRSQTWVRQP